VHPPVNAGPTAERVYDTLKRAMMERRFRPGDRLDPAMLAEDLNSSTTPVREALDRLVGEDLVESRTGSGFHVPAIDEPGLKDMYAWCADLLGLAVRGRPRTGNVHTSLISGSDAFDGEPSLARRVETLFAEIGRRSLNSEHGRALERINARLHAARLVEPLVIEDADDEFGALEAACRGAGDKLNLLRRITAYHRRRVRLSAGIVRALYRAD
jgi:DNA-binding transcriptional MocR family regulator